jgi:hypothetical protein
MVGDRPRDVEAGLRAGCRTIRIRAGTLPTPGEAQDENIQPDFTARNLVEAARIILREARLVGPRIGAAAEQPAPPPAVAGGGEQAPPQPAAAQAPGEAAEALSDRQMRLEVLRHLRQLARAEGHEEFSFTKLIGGIVQVLAALALVIALWRTAVEAVQQAQLWATLAVTLQVMALTFFTMRRAR